MQTVDELSKRFNLKDEVWFENISEDYPVVRVRNAHAKATIALHGAHLTDYCLNEGKPIIFTSNAAIFREGKAIRGGIPVCWPWFGSPPNKQPSHGYARTNFWQLERVESSEEGTRLVFSLSPLGDSALAAILEFHIGKELQLALHTMNTGQKDETFSEALHSYLMVNDARQTQVTGLDGCSYIDTIGEESIHTQTGAVNFPDEIDRIYQSSSDTMIEDLVSGRKILVSKTGSNSTVVWNPGQEKGSSMDDLLNEEIDRFVCVESANVRDQSITLKAGENHILHLRISTES